MIRDSNIFLRCDDGYDSVNYLVRAFGFDKNNNIVNISSELCLPKDCIDFEALDEAKDRIREVIEDVKLQYGVVSKVFITSIQDLSEIIYDICEI